VSDAFAESLLAVADGIDDALERLAPAASDMRGAPLETFLAIRDMGLKVRSFIGAFQRSETGYVTFLGRTENGGKRLKVYCVDPSHDLSQRLEMAKASVFFSGTLLPMDYQRRLLAAQDGDATVYGQSSFDRRRQQVLIASDVSARFSRRGPRLYAHIAAYLMALARARPGNYLAFLPSYALMDEVAKVLNPLVDGRTTVVRQRPGMREDERERFVAQFSEVRTTGTSLIGLCVLGGVFGESIDLPGERLVGVVVVGTGMPRSSSEREVIKDYFDVKKGKGFVYAYTYPGLVKVLQAAGRLIRTEEDRGVVLLLDNRFLEQELPEAFPKEWTSVHTCTLETLPTLLGQI
jgi:Rad3-related DNA helicase